MDLRLINQFCETPKFRNEDIGTVLDYVQPHDLLITLDIENGFHHIPVAVEHHKFLGITFQGGYFVWQVLPFGLSSSLYFFCKTVRPVISFLRMEGVRITSYVDDFCLCAQQQHIDNHKRLLIGTLSWLGWVINEEKSTLHPESSKQYIGYKITTGENPALHVPNERIYKLRKDLKRVLSKCHITARMLARIAGQCVSMSKAVQPAKLMLRRLLASKTSWSDVLMLDENTKSDLQWWVQALSSWNGTPIHRGPIEMQMETDASTTTGWGACITTPTSWQRDSGTTDSDTCHPTTEK